MALRAHIGDALEYLGWMSRARGRNSEVHGPVFVVGTGRSGTHFLTRSIIQHPELTDLVGGVENRFVFSRVENLAQSPAINNDDFNALARRYKLLAMSALPRQLVDQSHTNIWLADKWVEVFPNARFLALIRNPVSVAYSTTRHSGVRRWLEPPYPVAGDTGFIGNRGDLFPDYRERTIYEKSAIRWASHVLRTDELLARLTQEKVHLVCYEELCLQPQKVLEGIANFLQLDNQFPLPTVKEESLRKMENVPATEVDKIEAVLRIYFSRFPLSGFMREQVSRYVELG